MSSTTWDHLDGKVLEAEFFLAKLKDAGTNFFEARCYLSAFASASRSITFTLQALLTREEGFDAWWKPHQVALKQDRVARRFVDIRNASQKTGFQAIVGGSSRWPMSSPQDVLYYFADEVSPGMDVVSASHSCFCTLLRIVLEAYRTWGSPIERPSFFSVPNLRSMGLDVEGVEEALGFPRGWTAAPGLSDEERLALLRRQKPDLLLDRVFLEYLGTTVEPGDQRMNDA